MKTCPKCKAKIEDEARFCLYCMTSFEKKQTIEEPNGNNKRWPHRLVTILAVVFVVLGVVFVMPKHSDKQNNDVDSGVLLGNEPTTTAENNVTTTDEQQNNKFEGAATVISTTNNQPTLKSKGTVTEKTTASAALTSGNTKSKTTTTSFTKQSSSNKTSTTATTEKTTASTPLTSNTTKSKTTTTAFTKQSSNNKTSTTATTEKTTVSAALTSNTTKSKTTTTEKTTVSTALTSNATKSKTTARHTTTSNSLHNGVIMSPTTATETTTTTVLATTTSSTAETATYLYRDARYGDDFSVGAVLENAVVITGVKTVCADGVYEIPETLDGKKVIAIMAQAFNDETIRDTVKTVIVPATVKTIWNYAFSSCYQLTDIYFKGNSIYTEAYAFAPLSKRSGTLTIHCSSTCNDRNYRYYKNSAWYYDAQYKEWNG